MTRLMSNADRQAVMLALKDQLQAMGYEPIALWDVACMVLTTVAAAHVGERPDEVTKIADTIRSLAQAVIESVYAYRDKKHPL